jgi:uncharacterized protein (TIGR02246 family)
MKSIAGLMVVGILLAPTARAQAPGGPEQELIKVWNDWKQAVIKRDAAALRNLYADEYMSIDSEGGVWNKAEDIEIDTSGSFRLATYKLADVKVRLLGEVAIVTGRSFYKGTGTTRREISAQYRFTDVFVKRAGRWQVVHSHLTALATLP